MSDIPIFVSIALSVDIYGHRSALQKIGGREDEEDWSEKKL